MYPAWGGGGRGRKSFPGGPRIISVGFRKLTGASCMKEISLNFITPSRSNSLHSYLFAKTFISHVQG